MADCPHYAVGRLRYEAFFADAERRTANGEDQKQCPVCHRWLWESLFVKSRTETDAPVEPK